MEPAQQRAALFAKLDYLLPPSTRSSLQHELIMANNSINIPTTPPEIQDPPAYHMVVDPNAPIPNMTNVYHPLDDMDDPRDLDDMEPETAESSEDGDEDEDDYTIPVLVNANTNIHGHGNIIGFEPTDARKVAHILYQLMGRPQPQQPGAEEGQLPVDAAGSANHAVLNIPLQGKKLRIEINCNTTIAGSKNIVGPGLGQIARTMAIARARQAEAAQGQAMDQTEATLSTGEATQGASPPASGNVSEGEGEGSGGVKRKADDEDIEGSPKAKKAELSL